MSDRRPSAAEPSRRHFLRAAGVAMALPWMDSLHAWTRGRFARRAEATPPARFAVLFSGNGFHGREWWARGEGSAMELGAVLSPLLPLRERLLLVRGLFNAEALKGNIHSSQTGNLLSGAPLASGGEIRSGTSIDQVLAQHLGRATKLPSLVLGCEKSNPSVHKNYSMLYSSHISWSSPTTPTPLEIYPALAFDRLFREDAEKSDASVLDAVRGEARSVRARLGGADQRKLDEYLESVREIERAVQGLGRPVDRGGFVPALAAPDLERPADGLPAGIDEHMRLMCDLLALAFRTDTTRIATLKLNNDHSSLRFPHLGVDYMIHHLLSHSDTPDWLKVNQFFLSQLAYLAEKLRATSEGDATTLDRTILLYLSSMRTGNHDADDLPVAVLGGQALGVRGGRSLDYRADPQRQMCRLYLSIARRMGVGLAGFGDAAEGLPEV